jgi:hypothetical protein
VILFACLLSLRGDNASKFRTRNRTVCRRTGIKIHSITCYSRCRADFICSLRVKLYSINLGAMYRICSSDAERGCSIVAGHWNAAGIYCLQAIETVVGQVGSIRPMHSAVAANQRRQEPLYSARVSLDAMQMQIEDKMVNPGPGMAVTVESKIVTRRLIEYLMSSQFRFRHESLRER